MSSYNILGGTPKKTLDLMKYFGSNSVLYVYEDSFSEYKANFRNTGSKIYEGFYNRNLIKHIRLLLKIVDHEGINIIQTQFFMGELLGYLIKLFRPDVKFIIAFVGPFKPNIIKSIFSKLFYRTVDSFVFISSYVKNEKIKQFPLIDNKNHQIIYNGTENRINKNEEFLEMKRYSLLDIAGLVKWKNIQILIEAFDILINKNKNYNYYLYIIGEGPFRSKLEKQIKTLSLTEHVFLIGYQTNVGGFLNSCDIFVHPSYAEGFGIVIPEAMFAEKPIIVSSSGAHPELIEHEKTGLIVDAQNAKHWVDAILRVINNPQFAQELAKKAKESACKKFTVDVFIKNYENLYYSLINN